MVSTGLGIILFLSNIMKQHKNRDSSGQCPNFNNYMTFSEGSLFRRIFFLDVCFFEDLFLISSIIPKNEIGFVIMEIKQGSQFRKLNERCIILIIKRLYNSANGIEPCTIFKITNLIRNNESNFISGIMTFFIFRKNEPYFSLGSMCFRKIEP